MLVRIRLMNYLEDTMPEVLKLAEFTKPTVKLGIFDYIEKHKEHHRQCPNCGSEDVKFAKHLIDNKEMLSAHCYECEHEEIAPDSDAEQLVDKWFNA